MKLLRYLAAFVMLAGAALANSAYPSYADSAYPTRASLSTMSKATALTGTYKHMCITETGYAGCYDAIADSTASIDGVTVLAFSDTPATGRWVRSSALQNGYITPQWFLPTAGTGTVDSTAAFQSLVNLGGHVYIPYTGTRYRITGTVTIASPLTLEFAPGACVLPDVGLTDATVFAVNSSNVTIINGCIDGTGLTFTTATGNHYGFRLGADGSSYSNIKFVAPKFLNWSFSDGASGYSNLLVSHAIYSSNVTNLTVEHGNFDTLSGAALFVNGGSGSGVHFNYNRVHDANWYNVSLNNSTYDIEVGNNIFDNTGIPSGVQWGGAIDVMSQTSGGGGSGVQDKKTWIHDNDIQGYYSYGAALRYESAHGLVSERNTLHNWGLGTWPSGADCTGGTISGVGVITRGTSTSDQNGPSKDITVRDSVMEAPHCAAGAMIGTHMVYVTNDWQTGNNPATNITIENNTAVAVGSEAWSNGVAIHGMNGGIEGIHILHNSGTTLTVSGSSQAGAISLIANNVGGAVKYVDIDGNKFKDAGTPSASYQTGLYLGAYTDYMYLGANTFDTYWFGVYAPANSGCNLYDPYKQTLLNIGSQGYVMGGTCAALPLSDSVKYNATTSALADPSNIVNQAGKYAGKVVFNTTNAQPYWAVDGVAASAWKTFPAATGSITIGTTTVALGGTSTTLAGLTSLSINSGAGVVGIGADHTSLTSVIIDGSTSGSYLNLRANGTTYAYLGEANAILGSLGTATVLQPATNTAASGTGLGFYLPWTVNQSGTAGYTAWRVNVTETAVGSGAKLLADLQVGGVSKFSVDDTGILTALGALKAPALVSTGSAPTLTGTCTTASQTGGNTAGTFTATCVAQTVIITFATTAPTGWDCSAHDQTTPADILAQTASSTTSCTLTGTTVAADIISFHATAF